MPCHLDLQARPYGFCVWSRSCHLREKEARVEIIWHRSKVLASGKFNGNDLDVEVTSNARFFFIVLPPVFPRVLSDIILT